MMKKKFVHYIFLFLCICMIMQTAVIKAEAATLSDTDRTSAVALEMGKNYSQQYGGYNAKITTYKLSVDKNGIFEMKIGKAQKTSDITLNCYVRIYNANGQEMIALCNTDAKTKETYLNVGLSAGTYYMQFWIQGDITDKGKSYSYLCSFNATDASEREKNDTKETATGMALNTEYTGYLGGRTNLSGYEDDVYDVYKVSLTKGGKYVLSNTDTSLDCQLLTNDKAIGSSGIGRNVTYTAAYTGDYYVVVTSSNKSKAQTAYKVMVKSSGSEPQKDPEPTPGKETDPDVAEDKDVNYNPQISPKATKITSLKSLKKAITIKWKKVSGNGYIIQYGTKKSFKGAKKKVITNGKKTKLTIKKLKKGKKYYVRIRAYKVQQGTKYYSKWSGKKSIKVK